MKICTCRNCGHVFTVTKPMPFCSASCRKAHTTKQSNQLTIHEGVSHDISNTENKDQASSQDQAL